MAYYMRFFAEETLPRMSDIRAAFLAVNPEYTLSEGEDVTLSYAGEDIAVLEKSVRGEEPFEEEIEEFLEALAGPFWKRRRVEKCLKSCRNILSVQVLMGGEDSGQTLDRIAPLWHHLMKRCEGLIQADGEGFYARTKLILELK